MNSVVRDLRRSFRNDEAQWHKNKEEESLSSEIMSHVRFFEDHGDAVERSGYSYMIGTLLEKAYAKERSRELLRLMKVAKQYVEREIEQ